VGIQLGVGVLLACAVAVVAALLLALFEFVDLPTIQKKLFTESTITCHQKLLFLKQKQKPPHGTWDSQG
jgi:predicted outer membrane lipoprotein